MRRITVEVGMEAYRITGWLPRNNTNERCALATVIASGLATPELREDADPRCDHTSCGLYHWIVVSDDYDEGFMTAFDGCDEIECLYNHPADKGRILEGYADGLAVRQALEPYWYTGVPTPPDTAPIEWEEAVV